MKTITCTCGNNVQLDYSCAARVFVAWIEYWTFRCSQCGQEYHEEVKDPIIL